MATDSTGGGKDIFSQLSSADTSQLQGEQPPSEAVVDFLHARASTTRPEDIHHFIGTGDADSAAGSHQHNGKDSKLILQNANVVLTDITATATGSQIATAVNAINAVFRNYFGSN